MPPIAVATIDVFAKDKSLGRGVVTVGDHARPEELPAKLAENPLVVSSPPVLNVSRIFALERSPALASDDCGST